MVKKIDLVNKPPYRLIGSLLFLSAVSCGLLAFRIIESDSLRYGFLIWNLALAAIPAPLAWLLIERIKRYGWGGWQQIVLLLLWVVILPNSFYIITDFIHLRSNYEADLLFDISVLTSFALSGMVFGFISIYLVHSELVKKLRERYAYLIIGTLFLVLSFAICLGRYTRWNTWDILLRPAGLLFDVSDRLINPTMHAQTYQTTATMFLLLFGTYLVLWESARLISQK